MSKADDFIRKEKDKYGKLYTDISYAIDKVAPFVDSDVLNRRKYYTRLKVAKKYVELLSSAETELNSKGFFAKLGNNDKYIHLLEDFKHDNKESLNILKGCQKCQCLDCVATCKFDSCDGCAHYGRIASCDKKRTCVYTYNKTYTLDLENQETGKDDRFNVLAIVQDVLQDKRYIIMENVRTNEKFVLYYFCELTGDRYEEIASEEDFNYAVDAYQGIEK